MGLLYDYQVVWVFEVFKTIASSINKNCLFSHCRYYHMLCQFKILLLTHKRNFPILTLSKRGFLVRQASLAFLVE